jgi:hypothetical protein
VETVVSEAEERILNVIKQNSRSIEETEMAVEALLNLDTQDGHNEIPPTQLISLDQSQDNGNVSFEPENPEHLLDLITSGQLNIIATADINGEAIVPSSIWSSEVENLFSPSPLCIENKTSQQLNKKVKKNTSHRLLTSQEIITEKKLQSEEKQRKEIVKIERKRKQEENKLKKIEEQLKKKINRIR